VESARCMLVNLGLIGSMTVHSPIVTVRPRYVGCMQIRAAS
jgi:hypothetical protein